MDIFIIIIIILSLSGCYFSFNFLITYKKDRERIGFFVVYNIFMVSLIQSSNQLVALLGLKDAVVIMFVCLLVSLVLIKFLNYMGNTFEEEMKHYEI